jgi:dGTPase
VPNGYRPYESPYGYDEWDFERYDTEDPPEPSYDEPAADTDIRPPFARDHDRLVYTSAFRRLQGKTQVVTPGQADFFHTRLTHTAEVSQVARRLAEYLNFKANWPVLQGTSDGEALRPWQAARGFVDPDICEAAAILHDLGHPPFGHAGEVALQEAVTTAAKTWGLSDTGSFEGNAQSFRMATRSLTHKRAGRGLELTRATLDAALKYPWRHLEPGVDRSGKKWGVYPTEAAAFGFVRDQRVPAAVRRATTVEAEVMDWADEIAYSVHDLDDWFRAGYMPLAELTQAGSRALERLIRDIKDRWEVDPGRPQEELHGTIVTLFTASEAFRRFREPTGQGSVSDPSSEASREAVRYVRSRLFDEFTTSVSLGIREGAEADWPRRYALTLVKSPWVTSRNAILRELLWIYVVGSPLMATHQAGQQRVVRELFDIFAQAAREPDARSVEVFPVDVRDDILDEEDSLRRLRNVVDFVSGMTDAYAHRMHARMTGRGVPFQDFL